ncbi:hypothetical protein [Pseudoxanthomonas sp. PXM02]|uniref:hypothetical protein n=1 Tax=Pseudoxanthomonas sp. PXM02 TaxID=2769294 RepID=UPI00177D8A09|nr:hypothetical protein [Pseudoxanthomonas sp. PXM02]MBD9477782.1 hypothetical protein [Pseudoxanthomonas sp. PXM02]
MDAVLRSNRGVSQLTMRLTPRSAAAWDCTLVLVDEHWSGGGARPFTASVGGFVLTAEALDALHRHVVAWLDSPLAALVSSRLDASFELAEAGQSFCLRFGPVERVIADAGKPVGSLGFSIGTLSGSAHFVTDPSCLALFADTLGQALSVDSTSLMKVFPE